MLRPVVKKFVSNKLNLITFSFLFLVLIVTVFSSYLRPDSTKDVQILYGDASKLKPGTEVDNAKIKRNSIPKEVGFFSRLFFGGTEPEFDAFRMDSVRFHKDSVTFYTLKNQKLNFKNYQN